MKQYQDLVRKLINKFDRTKRINGDRTNVGTVKVTGEQLRFDLSTGRLPMVTLKLTRWIPMLAELLWFLSGSTSNVVLEAMGCKFWRPWAVTEKDIVLYYAKKLGMHSVAAGLLDADKANPVNWGVILDEWIANGNIPESSKKYIGQLGPIYSKTWTELEDTRIIDVDEWNDEKREIMLDVGFEPIGVTRAGDEVVVTRDINQIAEAIDHLKKDPDSRRIIVNAWEPRLLPVDRWPDGSKKTPQENVIEGRAALAYCHAFFQYVTEELDLHERFHVAMARRPAEWLTLKYAKDVDTCEKIRLLNEADIPTHRLDCVVTIRSSDVGLGLPYNFASYALLQLMVAQCVNMTPGELIINTGDTHLYANQIEPMRAILDLEPLPAPTVKINPEVKDIFQFKMEDFELVGYQYHPPIKMDAAV